MTRKSKLIREVRTDMTDYVIHFTRDRCFDASHAIVAKRRKLRSAFKVLMEILEDGVIRPTFAPLPNRQRLGQNCTISGPHRAVCFTDQTLAAVLETRSVIDRYSGYGIAFHKHAIKKLGGGPVIYRPRHEWDQFPEDFKFLLANYETIAPCFADQDPVDFTWEKEWRVRARMSGFAIVQKAWNRFQTPKTPLGAIIVEKKSDVPKVRDKLDELYEAGRKWVRALNLIISLETAQERLASGFRGYGRIDTWPKRPKIKA